LYKKNRTMPGSTSFVTAINQHTPDSSGNAPGGAHQSFFFNKQQLHSGPTELTACHFPFNILVSLLYITLFLPRKAAFFTPETIQNSVIFVTKTKPFFSSHVKFEKNSSSFKTTFFIYRTYTKLFSHT